MTSSDIDWDNAKSSVSLGATVDCLVVHHEVFGIFVQIDGANVAGLIERVRMNQDGYNTPEEYPPVGSRVKATVLGFRDWSKQIELALNPKAGASSQTEVAIEVGLRFGASGELVFFGLEDVNSMLRNGKKVVRTAEGRAIMKKSGEQNDTVKVQFVGFSVVVVVQN